MATEQRHVLLLQGPFSWFFTHLGRALRARGAQVTRVLLCPGDALFWRGPGAVSYRGRPGHWAGWIADLAARRGVSDLVCLGDGRAWHRDAIAALPGVRVHVVEQGILRPGWLTLEQGGLGPQGRFPRMPERIRALGADHAMADHLPADYPPADQLPANRRPTDHLSTEHPPADRPPADHPPADHPPADRPPAGHLPADHRPADQLPVALAEPSNPPRWRTSFAAQSAMDVAFNLANLLLGRLTYPHFRIHTLDPPALEWAGWAGKALRWPWRRAARDRALARIAAHEGPVFLFALQLETDFAIRQHGPAGGVAGALAAARASFAAHAPANALLVVKPHPLDPGLAGWPRQSRGDRVLFLDGGDLGALFPRLAGMVTVNSTAGMAALEAGLPVAPMGAALYDLPGLTHQGGLDRFWTAPQPPDAGLYAALVRALKRTIQLPGHFDGEGARPGAEAVAARVLSPLDWSGLDGSGLTAGCPPPAGPSEPESLNGAPHAAR